MPLSEAKKQANKRWNEANPYDHVPLFVPLGGKAQIKNTLRRRVSLSTRTSKRPLLPAWVKIGGGISNNPR